MFYLITVPYFSLFGGLNICYEPVYKFKYNVNSLKIHNYAYFTHVPTLSTSKRLMRNASELS